MDKLTLKQLKKMQPGIFASGTVSDNPTGINITNSGKLLRWVAVRGQIHDWAIYCYWADASEEYVKDHGDKVYSEKNIKKLVPCSDKAFEMYRY